MKTVGKTCEHRSRRSENNKPPPLVFHDRAGRLREKYTYGQDPENEGRKLLGRLLKRQFNVQLVPEIVSNHLSMLA